MKKIIALLLCITLLVGCLSLVACNKEDGNGATEENIYEQFSQFNLDTSKQVELNFYGYLENFDGLESVITDFEKLYPNCSINYSYTEAYDATVSAMLKNDPSSVHLYMYRKELTAEDALGNSYTDYATDFLDASQGMSLKDINMECTSYEKIGDKLYSVPLMLNTRAMCVNKTLLAKYNLGVPKNWAEFLNACKVMKDNGMTPIQCAAKDLGVCLIYPYIASSIVYDDDYEAILAEANAFTEGSGQYFGDAFGRLVELCKTENKYYDLNEYVDAENKPISDNYNPAILNFFEGDVAFFPCTAETYSGMEKRETVEGSPYDGFEYDYVGSPVGDNGAYVYWFTYSGFSVNPKCNNNEWARAFSHFLLMGKNMNTVAIGKGMPANVIASTDSKYTTIKSIPAPYQTNSSKFTVNFYSELGYTYEKIYKLDKRVYELGEGETYVDKAVAYYEGKIATKRK